MLWNNDGGYWWGIGARAMVENKDCYWWVQQGHHKHLRKSWRGGKPWELARNTALSFWQRGHLHSGCPCPVTSEPFSLVVTIISTHTGDNLRAHPKDNPFVGPTHANKASTSLCSHRVPSILTLLIILTVKQPNKWITHAALTSPCFPRLQGSNFGPNHGKKSLFSALLYET